MSDSKKLTRAFGMPVGDDQNSMTAGPRGPVLLQDVHFLEKMSHFDRERIPERVVHAKGNGAFGYFEVTHDVTRYTKAAFLSKVGKRTEVFARFSTVGGEKGSADTERAPRGFALKFYTEDGNYDMVGNNTPIFFIRDPLKFPDFIHTQKPQVIANPVTFNQLLDKASTCIQVDKGLTSDTVRDLALSMRLTTSDSIVLMQAPISGFANLPNGDSIDVVDQPKMDALSTAIKADTIDDYVAKYGKRGY